MAMQLRPRSFIHHGHNCIPRRRGLLRKFQRVLKKLNPSWSALAERRAINATQTRSIQRPISHHRPQRVRTTNSFGSDKYDTPTIHTQSKYAVSSTYPPPQMRVAIVQSRVQKTEEYVARVSVQANQTSAEIACRV